MDNRPPFTVTGKIPKTRADGKSSEAPKSKVKEPLVINREKRVFGTVRNQNALAKPLSEKPARKPGIPQKQPKQLVNPTAVQETQGTPKKSTTSKKKSASFRDKIEENKVKILQEGDISRAGAGTPVKSPFLIKPKKKKSVNFSEEVKEKVVLQEDDDVVIQTPLRSPFLIKPNNVSGTPYHSAERCSKCRFDKLETSSYWLGHIRLAESVGKHFVSAAFFSLASDCKAEPIRNMKVELKKYLGRHRHLSGEKEWKDLCVNYGLIKEESSMSQEEHQVKGTTNEETAEATDPQEEKQIMLDSIPVEPSECE